MPINRGFKAVASAIIAAIFLTVTAFAGRAVAAEPPIRVGTLLGMSNGPFVLLSQDVVNGLTLAFEENGSAINGRAIELIKEDTTHKPDVALAKAKELIYDDKADILVGPLSASEMTPLVSVVTQARVPLIPLTGDNGVTGNRCSPWVIRTSFSDDQVVRDLGAWMYSKGYKKIAIVASDYTAGHEIAGAFKRTFVGAGGTIVSEQYPPLGPVSDFGPYLTKVKADEPNAVFAFVPGVPGVAFIKQFSEYGLKKSITLSVAGFMLSTLNLPALGGAADDVIGILDYVPSIDNPTNVAFKKAYEAKFNKTVSEYAAYGYDTGKLIVAALTALNGNMTDKAALIEAIHAAKIEGTRGPLRIDPKTNNIIQDIYVFKAEKNGDQMDLPILERFKDVQDPPSGCAL